MSAATALVAARAAGIQLRIDGGDLVLEAPAPPPADVLDPLSRHKAGLVELLRPVDDGWSAADWRAFYDAVQHEGQGGGIQVVYLDAIDAAL